MFVYVCVYEGERDRKTETEVCIHEGIACVCVFVSVHTLISGIFLNHHLSF